VIDAVLLRTTLSHRRHRAAKSMKRRAWMLHSFFV
jgi:hypothetical protein